MCHTSSAHQHGILGRTVELANKNEIKIVLLKFRFYEKEECLCQGRTLQGGPNAWDRS